MTAIPNSARDDLAATSLSAQDWCAVAAATTGAALQAQAQSDAAAGAARVLGAADRAARRELDWNTPLLPAAAVLQELAR